MVNRITKLSHYFKKPQRDVSPIRSIAITFEAEV